jgi:hypothetical protein
MKEAVAAYTGPVRQFPPGKARAPAERVLVTNKSVEWLIQHRRDPKIVDEDAKRRQSRLAKYNKDRNAARNAMLLKRIAVST